MQQIKDFRKQEVESDLEGFGRKAVIAGWNGKELEVRWERRGQEQYAFFEIEEKGNLIWLCGKVDPNTPEARKSGSDEPETRKPYEDFLRDELAGFSHIAKAMVEGKSNKIPASHYTPTKARIREMRKGRNSDSKEMDSDKLLMGEIESTLKESLNQTRILFVKGDAGAGKSTLLEQLVLQQAGNSTWERRNSCSFMFPRKGVLCQIYPMPLPRNWMIWLPISAQMESLYWLSAACWFQLWTALTNCWARPAMATLSIRCSGFCASWRGKG